MKNLTKLFMRYTFNLLYCRVLLVTFTILYITSCGHVTPTNTGGGVKQKGATMTPSFRVNPVVDLGGAGIGKPAAVADLNADGLADIASINGNSGSIKVSLGQLNAGNLTYSPTSSVAIGAQPIRVLLVDLNADDIDDMVVVNHGSDDLTVALGKGNGEFDIPSTVPVNGDGPTFVAAADLDSDGKVDLVSTNAFTHHLSIMSGDGVGGFTVTQQLDTPPVPMGLEIADMNADGSLDLISVSRHGALVVYYGDGAGGFQSDRNIKVANPTVFPYGDDIWQIAGLDVADFDKDGLLDIATVSVDRDIVHIYRASSVGAYLRPANSLPVGMGPRAVTVQDFNGDGELDLAVLSYLSNEVSMILGMGVRASIAIGTGEQRASQLMFTRTIQYLAPPDARDLIATELDGDGRPDLIVASNVLSGSSASEGIGASSMAMMSSEGAIQPPRIVSVTPPMGHVAGGTILKIMGLNFQVGARVFVDGREATGITVSPQNEITATAPPAALGNAGSVEVRVINPNGEVAIRPDSFIYKKEVSEFPNFTRLVFCNDGAEPAGFPSQQDCSDYIRIFKDIEVADFNKDGLLDLYAPAADNTSAADLLYLNTGKRTMHPVTRRDGEVDFLASSLFDLHDVASGTTQPRYDSQAANILLEFSGEFDNGRVDIISVDGHRLRMLVNRDANNDGIPEFVDQVEARVYDRTELDENAPFFVWDDIDIGDIDLDGDLDIVLANRNRINNNGGNRGTYVLINDDGLGNFSAIKLPLSDTRGDHDVELSDIDNDCDLDLIFSGHSQSPPGDATILINTIRSSCTGPVGSFDESTYEIATDRLNFDPSRNPQFHFVGAESTTGPLDFNQDGFVDLLFGGRSGTALLLNRGNAGRGIFDEVIIRDSGGTSEVLLPQSGSTYGANFGDLDLDGRVDMVLGDYDGRPMIYLNRIEAGDGVSDVQAMAMPFEEYPPRVGAARGDSNGVLSPWQSVNPMFEADVLNDSDDNGLLSAGGPQMGVELHDLDGDNDLDIVLSYGDGGAPRLNRIFLNNTRAQQSEIDGVRGRNDEGREIVHWRDEVSFVCFGTVNTRDVTLTIIASHPTGAEGTLGPITKTLLQAQAENIDRDGDGIADYVFTFPELFPLHGNTEVIFDYQLELGDGSLISATKNQSIFIDPSGFVFDNETLQPIIGATVTLEIQDGSGVWGAPAMMDIRPEINPQTTVSGGRYGWDVAGIIPRNYRVQVQADGYESKTSRVVSVPPPVLDLNVGLTPIKITHFLWQETVILPKLKHQLWLSLQLDEETKQALNKLAGNRKLHFEEAEPGSRFKGAMLNWPLSELGLELESQTGELHGDVDAKRLRAQTDPFFLGLINVVDSQSGDLVAEIWLEISFENKHKYH